MRKRLRKKKRIGEFAEWGVQIGIALKSEQDFDGFLDDFIEQAIEANQCRFGGGGRDDRVEGFVELGRTLDGPAERLQAIRLWLNARRDVRKYVLGGLVDPDSDSGWLDFEPELR